MKSKLPPAINSEMVTQPSGKELLLYNLKTNKAYCLNETATRIYLACDGKTSFEELKAQTDFSDDLIFLALDDLKRETLIATDSVYIEGVSRREMIKKVGLTTMATLPLITSLTAPKAVHAQSVGTGSCLQNPPPASGCLDGIYSLGTASSDSECETRANNALPCCGCGGRSFLRDPITQCCTVTCSVNPYC